MKYPFEEWLDLVDAELFKLGEEKIPEEYRSWSIYEYQDGTTPELAAQDRHNANKAQKEWEKSLSKRGCYVIGFPFPVEDIDPEKERKIEKRNNFFAE